VSHFVKQAMLDLAEAAGLPAAEPANRAGWAHLAQALSIRTIHIAERDTQVTARRKAPGEFVNTWSIDGFVSEGCQPAELGWGTHETNFPPDGARHVRGCRSAIYLRRPGAATRVRTWTPLTGPQHGFLITHSESISIADFLTVGDPQAPSYRPTVYYAYHPCDDAVLSVHELAGRNWRLQPEKRLIKEDIESGTDALGVLLMGPAHGAYWYGSMLDIDTTRALCTHNNATSLQVTAAVVSGVIWAMRNPDRGILEPDDLPHREIMAMARPYLGEMVGVYTDWTPVDGRGWLMDEAIDEADPWQFGNFRVT
jgi:homospermidine synthase